MRSLACVLLVLAGMAMLVAVPTAASCVDCYGNFCGDRTTCCGSDGFPQSQATADTPPCDDLDALCKAHDLCTAELADDDTTAGMCMCDKIFKDGIEKAKTDPSFNYNPDMCAISPLLPAAGEPGSCLPECSFVANAFTLDTAVDFVAAKDSCTCSSGTLAGTVVDDPATDCPAEDKCVQHVCKHNKHKEFMHLGWFWRRVARRRTWWWSWLWQSHRPAPPPECDGSLVPPQPPATQCTISFINVCVKNVPDACKCHKRDFRCLMQKNIFRGLCKSHVTTLVNCVTSDPRVVVFRSLLASSDFNSDESGMVTKETVTEQIKLVYWAPVMAVLFVGLLTSLTYLRIRSKQYKKRIEMLNSQIVGSRSTGLSVVNGEELLNINPASDSSAEISTQ